MNAAESLDDILSVAMAARSRVELVPDAPPLKAPEEARPPVLDYLPARFAWATLDSPLLSQRVKVVRDPLRAGREMVKASNVTIFGSGTGVGKTSLTNAAFREWIARNRRAAFRARYNNAQAMALHVQWAALGKVPEAIDKALHASHYVLDALGTETHHATNPFAAILVHRMEAGRPTWVTTHLGEKEIVARYGAAAFRALTEGALVLGELK